MISIRKFVASAGAAAGIGTALALAVSTQTGWAATQAPPASNDQEPQITLSAPCAAAIQKVKTAFIADVSEDRTERLNALIDHVSPIDPVEESAEAANFKSLFAAVRTACAPSAATVNEPAEIKTFSPSAACTTALQKLKAAWQARPTMQAQWTQLQSLAATARTACGWTATRAWSDVR